jgi:hypothetical protein|nr:MAG TPA: hypothetical protein [Caudoviricetes sp.]DAV96158.1 MAG TPA: hypothetical protein [Caudoviricetes sp.]
MTMLKKTITYTDYDGLERTEEFRFNLTKAELMDMELTTVGTFSKLMQKIIDEKDMVRLAKYFKELILKSYGVKSDDGKRFIKSPELSEAFSQTEAYSELYMELLGNSEYAVKFIQQVMPKDLDQNEVVPAGNVTVLPKA